MYKRQTLSTFGPGRIWVEDEANNIGGVRLPKPFSQQVRTSAVVVLDVPVATRVEHLVEIYGDESPDRLASSFEKIQKRLGPARARDALEALKVGDLSTAVTIALAYYDKAYDYGLSKRENTSIHHLNLPSRDDVVCAKTLIRFVEKEFV